MSEVQALLREIQAMREEIKVLAAERHPSNSVSKMVIDGCRELLSIQMASEILGKSQGELQELAEAGEVTFIKTDDGQRYFYKEDIMKAIANETRAGDGPLLILKFVEDFDFNKKPHQTDCFQWGNGNGLAKKIKAGDRFAMIKKGEHKVYAIGTVTAQGGKSVVKSNGAGNRFSDEVTVKYDIVNPMGVALSSGNGRGLLYEVEASYRLLSRQEFDDLLVRVVRAY